MLEYLLVFSVVFVANVIPFFVPATWTILGVLSLYLHSVSILEFTFIGAIAATLGRTALAHFSHKVIHTRFVSEKTRHNIFALKDYLSTRKHITILTSLVYAFSPLQSSQLFIAYGLTGMNIVYVAIPFLIGRLVSYSLLLLSVHKISDFITPGDLSTGAWWYFLGSQILTIVIIYAFCKIPWRKFLPKTEGSI